MKIAKIALPLSVLALIGIILAALLYDKLSVAPDEEQLAYGIGYIVFLVINIIPMALFIPFGVGLLVCELCLFVARNKFATLTAALVLMTVLLPAVLFTVVLSLVMLARYAAAFAVIVSLGAVCYLAALVAVYIAYFKTSALRKKERLQN